MQKIQADLTSLTQRGKRLTAKRDSAQAEFETAQAARLQFILQGDLDDENVGAKLQGRVDSAASALSGFNEAIEALDVQMAEAKHTLGAEQARVERTAASDKLERDIEIIAGKLGPWLVATHDLAAALDVLGNLRFEAGAISRFCANAAGEVETAAAVVIPDLRGAALAIREGREAVPHVPQPPAMIEPPPKPEVKTVFCLKHLKYRGANGELVLIPKFSDAELAPALAAHAIKIGAACEVADPRRRQLHGTAPPHRPLEQWCINIGDDELNEQSEPVVRHTQFEPLDRGPAFIVKVPRGPEPMAATNRGADEVEKR